MKETIGDIDYIVSSDNLEKVMDYFVTMPEVEEILGKGQSKTFVRLNNGMDADLLVVPEESFGSALQYFTGSKEHGIAMRKIALAKRLHLMNGEFLTIIRTELQVLLRNRYIKC
jgi:DNA polymerase (family 10)